MGRMSEAYLGHAASRSAPTSERYPYVPSPGKTDTSAEAAGSFKSRHNRFWLRVRDILSRGPATNSEIFEKASGLNSDELKSYYELRDLERALQPRTGEALKRGDVIENGKRKNRNGRHEIVWALSGRG